MDRRLAQFHYRISWRSRSSRPGLHDSTQRGAGMAFSHHGGLLDGPDPRRFDLIASSRDPFQRLRLRIYRQTSAIPVVALVDFSASMAFPGKMQLVNDFVASLAYSGLRGGDPFAFIGCANTVPACWMQPPTHNYGAVLTLLQRLRRFVPAGTSMTGLAGVADVLASRRSLLFLLSDFHFPDALLRQVLPALTYHDLVPVVVWQAHEYRDLPGFGLARLCDYESGRNRTYWVRPSWRKRVQLRFERREQALRALFAEFGAEPLFFEGRFSADAVTRYFYG